MTVISSGIAFSAVKSIDNSLKRDSESQKPLGTPMMMQDSMVTTVVRPMSSAELERAMEFITRSKDSVKNLYKKGKGFYDDHEKGFKKIGGAFKAIQGLGDIISGIKKLQPEEENPMVKKLADLTTDVKALSEKLTDNFTEMKNFISQQTFFTDIMSPTAVLTMHMMDCLAYPGEDSKRIFLAAYENMSPLKMQYQLNAYLAQKTTNPLRLSLDLEKGKTKATFEKWEDIYCRVMAQFVLLEAFASGLMGAKSERNFDRLIEASSEVLNNTGKWREEYESDNGYWEEMKKKLVLYFKENTNKNNKEKAEEVKKMLEGYLTSDAFYILVFNTAQLNQYYTHSCDNTKEQVIGSWNEGGCNCIIYRSRTAQKIGRDEYEGNLRKVIDCRTKVYRSGTLENIIKTQLVDPKLLNDNGFIALIHTSLNVQVASVFNTSMPLLFNWGPGATGIVTMDGDYRYEYHLISGFP